MYSQAFVGPLIRLGVDGLLRLMKYVLVPLTPQAFKACTVKALELKLAASVTEMVVSFTPAPFGCVIVVVPFCAVHKYEVVVIPLLATSYTLGMVNVTGTFVPKL